MSLTIAALLLLEPAAGGRLLRYTLGGYLAAAGTSSLLFAWSIHRDTQARLKRFVETLRDPSD